MTDEKKKINRNGFIRFYLAIVENFLGRKVKDEELEICDESQRLPRTPRECAELLNKIEA
jgi:hypothetical protein